MKQCSSDARTMGHPTHSPFEFTATGMGGEREDPRWTRAVWLSPAPCPEYTGQGERGAKKKECL